MKSLYEIVFRRGLHGCENLTSKLIRSLRANSFAGQIYDDGFKAKRGFSSLRM
jgi:hypothetical protein